VLRLLRGGTQALGPIRGEGPEPRRNFDERGAASRLLRGPLVLSLEAPLGGGGGAARARGPMRRAGALLVLLSALALPGGAEANGDPASDVLLTTQVFLPFEAPISDSAASDLKQTVAASNEKGYTI